MKAVLGCLAAALLLAGCGGGGSSTTTRASPTAQQILARTAKKTSAAKSFHVVYALRNAGSGGAGLQLTSAEGDVAVPGKLKAKATGTLAGVALSTHVVVVGDHAWLENPIGGGWQRFETAASPLRYFDPRRGVFAVLRGAHGFERAGTATVGGVETYELHGTLPAKTVAPFLAAEPGDRQVDVRLYVGEHDFLLRRVVVDGPVNGSEPANVERVVTLSRFDEPVLIAAPA